MCVTISDMQMRLWQYSNQLCGCYVSTGPLLNADFEDYFTGPMLW